MPTIPQLSIANKVKRIPRWLAVDSIASSTLEEKTRDWLLDNSSLTLRVKNHCRAYNLGCFSVKVLHQGMAIPLNDEVQRLQLRNRHYALIREVLLYCGATPMIYARTVIPIQTLTGEQRQLSHLGNRPLGEFLFSQSCLQRDIMEVSVLNQGHQLFDSACANIVSRPTQVWARRSVFRLKHKPLLVAEVFLPDILRGSYSQSFASSIPSALVNVPHISHKQV